MTNTANPLAAEAAELIDQLAENGFTVIEENGLVFADEGEPDSDALRAALKRLQAIYDADPLALDGAA